MSEYVYHPEFSFLARCWWQLGDELLHPDQWDASTARLAPMWLHYGGAGFHNDHWYRYLRAEPEGTGPLRLEPWSYTLPSHVYGELFWFGAYVSGTERTGATLRYEMRPYDRNWKPLNRIVYSKPGVLSGFAGYAGVKDQTEAAAGRQHLTDPQHLWNLSGINHNDIKRGARLCNVVLVDAAGQRARRIANREAWLINTLTGEPGLMALEVLDYAHEARDVAWGTGLQRAGSSHVFKAEHSFIASLCWRPDEAPAGPAGSADGVQGLVAARFDEGWEWNPRARLSVEQTDSLGTRWRDDETRPACERFWFAAYLDNGVYAYEIWPLDERGRRLNFTLRKQTGWTMSLAQRWQSVRAEADFLWHLDGLDPATLQVGATVANVKLRHSSGRVVKLADRSERRLGTQALGEEGSLTVQVLETSARF
ncbi:MULTISPECIES: hypothetical protein [Pseudomonas]|uniref:Uncharacterized protein n=1 Tax=Pseudomonas asiatica TaxID=2219225 RepID=A0A9X4CYS4_9PSED|nr:MULTISPECIES: hypothetical protein [Pseudomonas]MDD2106471.1 hypothetical protein [Pseudomonas asiatica]